MARYKIKKKRSDLKTDVFVETTEDWVRTAKAWALPITLGVAAVAMIVVFWTWSSRAEAERLDKLWARLGALGQETMWNEEIAAKWDALLADTAGTAVEPHVVLRYAGRLIGEVKPEQLRKAAELLGKLESLPGLTPSLAATAADTRKRLDALLQFKPGEAGSGSAGGKQTSSSVQGPEPGAPAAAQAAGNAGPAAAAASGGDEPVVPPSGAAGSAGKDGDTKSSPGSGNNSRSKKKESKDAATAAEGAAAPASTGAGSAGVPAQGANTGAAVPGPATNQLPAADPAARKADAEEEREAVRKRQKPPP